MSTQFRWGLTLPLIVLPFVFGCDKGDEPTGGEPAGGAGTTESREGTPEFPAGVHNDEALIEKPELARRDIRGMMDRSRDYFERFQRFPDAAPLTPAEPPCGPEGRPFDATDWQHPTWRALRFTPRDPHHYSYQYDSVGTGPGARFVVTAIGDLDCDSVRSTFQRGATVMADGIIDSDDELSETNRDE